MLDEPKATRRMHALTQAPHAASLLARALGHRVAPIGGDFVNVELCDPTDARLMIAAQSGVATGSTEGSLVASIDGPGESWVVSHFAGG